MNHRQLSGRHVAGAVGSIAASFAGAQSLEAAVLAQTIEAELPPNISIDLDGDTVPEFQLADYHEANATTIEDTIKVSNFRASGGVGLALDEANYVANLPAGTLIGPSAGLTFAVPPGATDDLAGEKNSEEVGNFQIDDGAGYIGVEFTIEEATHYGYVGFQSVELDEANAGPEGRVFGFGYESEPNTPIAAGAGLNPTADVDADGDVDGNDFLLVQQGLGDAFDAGDFAAFTVQFGEGSAAAAAASGVPEPTQLAMLAAGAAGIAWLRRRDAHQS